LRELWAALEFVTGWPVSAKTVLGIWPSFLSWHGAATDGRDKPGHDGKMGGAFFHDGVGCGRSMNRVAAVIPTLNEAETIAGAIASLPRDVVDEVIVADSSSRDGTAAIAREAGARVVVLDERGYGRACAAGVAAAGAECGIILFLDGDGADRVDLAGMLVGPIRDGTHDFVIGSRVRGEREPGSMRWHQVVAGRVAGWIMSMLYGVRYTDMCAFRAIRRDALEQLDMREATYGWNIEMQMKAARAGLRVLELPVPYRCRAGGSSKVAGSLSGSVRAGWRIVVTIGRIALAHPSP
jgi:glycosyltransferase involved in cell wall biosynthesis